MKATHILWLMCSLFGAALLSISASLSQDLGPTVISASRRVVHMSEWNDGTISYLRRQIMPYTSVEPMRYGLKPRYKHRIEDQTMYYGQEDSSTDFVGMEQRLWPNHEVDPHCEPMYDWQSTFYPVCNEVHGWSLQQELVDERMGILSSKGFWRDAWIQSEALNITTNTTTKIRPARVKSQSFVWRTFKLEHDMEEAFFENNRVDAIAMERLTASPYVMSIYSFCGMSVVTEYAGKELASVAANLNSTEKLEIATQVAQGVADVHSIDERVSLVHNDINLANLVFTQDRRPVLNDFNIAILLMKHNTTGDTCPFVSHFPNPQWRAPEEQVYSEEESTNNPPLVTEKIDIYGLGNVFYRLAVNSSPWKVPGENKLNAEQKLHIAMLKRSNGALPDVPEYISNSTDPAIQTLLEAMYQAYRYDPKERPSAAELVAFLKEGLQQIVG